jgi:hypothetical protein
MGSFLSAIFGGSNPTLNQDIDQTGQQATWDTGQGQGDVLAGTNFLKSILSQDPTQQAKVLAPTISAANRTVQQDQKTGAMNGNRAGGTNASTTAAADKAHSDLVNAIAGLTGTAATALPSIGTNLTSQGTSATDLNAQLAQQRMKNWLNSILGKGITTAAQAAEGFALGKALPGTANGPTPNSSPSSPDATPGAFDPNSISTTSYDTGQLD